MGSLQLLGVFVTWWALVQSSREATARTDDLSTKCLPNLIRNSPCVPSTMQCQAAELALQPCVDWLVSNSSVHEITTTCCEALRSTAQNYRTCICLLVFYPPAAFNQTRQDSSLVFCNVSDTVCDQCPGILSSLPDALPPASGSRQCAHVFEGSQKKRRSITRPIVAGVTAGSVAIGLALCACLICIWKRKKRKSTPEVTLAREEILRLEGRPNVFLYKELKDATGNFHPDNKLGEGGFGEVFKGCLTDGSQIAVKKLQTSSRQGKREFLNEVTMITSVQHRNLVRLRGCCLKGDDRLLVYEFLENKSLYQALFDPTYPIHLDWPTRLKIAIGIARGLAYLHEGCQTRIIHRDVKASNILLDKDLTPKLSDFGLAKLIQDSQTYVSTRVAGTVGYLAPEYAMRGHLSEKADVFSYGIVLLELVSGRTNLDIRLPADMAYLLDLIWKLYDENRLMDLLDPKLKGGHKDLEEEATRVLQVALLCTQTDGSDRPAMARVLSLLQGELDVELPTMVKPEKYFEAHRKFFMPEAVTKRSTPESLYVFKSSYGSSSNYMSAVEPR